jgi:hypothetical protein
MPLKINHINNENLDFLRAMPGLHARDRVLQFDLSRFAFAAMISRQHAKVATLVIVPLVVVPALLPMKLPAFVQGSTLLFPAPPSPENIAAK